MSQFPNILDEGRHAQIVAVSIAGVGEAAIIGFAAFAMRDIFAALHSAEDLLVAPLTVLSLAGIFVAMLRVFGRTQAERLGQSFAISLRRRLFRHYLNRSRSEILQRRTGALELRFVGDLSALRGWVSLGLTRVVSASVVLPGAAIALSLLNPALALAAPIPIMTAIAAMVLLANFIEPMHRKLRSKRARIAVSMMERVGIAPELDLMGRTSKEVKALNAHGERLSEIAIERRRAVSSLQMIPEIGAGFAAVAILWTASVYKAPAAEAAAALAVLGILTSPLRDLAGVWDRFCAWRIARAKCEAVIYTSENQNSLTDRSGPVAIEFEQVRFRGACIACSIAAGETVLVSVETGAGKSTFLALAAGLEMPVSGKIRYGDHCKLPRSLSISANAPVLQGSLRRALTLGAHHRTEDRVIEDVARRFGFGPTLERLGGLSGRIGEGARTLSEGEKLRLHMIRAYLTKPNLVLVDAPLITTTDALCKALEGLICELSATTLIASVNMAPFDFIDRHLHISGGTVQDAPLFEAPAPNLSAA